LEQNSKRNGFQIDEFQIGTDLKLEQVSNWNGFQIVMNFKLKQILKSEQNFKSEQISNQNKFQN
jgi:hypothetical protein